MLCKDVAGEEWEQEVLRALRFDLIILCCLVLGPDQFKEVEQLRFQDVFAKQVNNDFEDRDPLIPNWIAKTSKAIAVSTIFFSTAGVAVFWRWHSYYN
jgi:hypothetical protein